MRGNKYFNARQLCDGLIVELSAGTNGGLAAVNKINGKLIMEIVLSESEERRYAVLQQMALDFARNGDIEALAGMLDAGMSVNLCDDRGNSLLMLAACNDKLDTVRMLLERGADVDGRNDHGQTPLAVVAFKGYEQLVHLLLQHGADINAGNVAGMTPIMVAAMSGRTRVVEQLRAHGASLSSRNKLGISAGSIVSASHLVTGLFRKGG